jgi:long-chain acyl-CoA synthetase
MRPATPFGRVARQPAFVTGRVAAYKYPRVLWIMDELPEGPTGKALKREISPPVNA